MNCSDAQHSLPGYLDDSIVASERTRLREHLHGCADCREELKSYSLLAAHLGRVEPIRPPANLALRIQAQASRRRLPWATLTRAFGRPCDGRRVDCGGSFLAGSSEHAGGDAGWRRLHQ